MRPELALGGHAPDVAKGTESPPSRWSAPFRVLRHGGFARVWTAGLVSQSGDYVLAVGLPYFVYRLTGSVLATGTMFLVIVVPPILVSSFAGVFVDRWRRKRTMVGANLLLGLGLLPLLWVTSLGTLWIVYVVAALEASIEPFFLPAEGALIPQLVPGSELVRANALFGGSRQIARLVGSAAGGLLVGIWGLRGAAGVDAASFFAAAAILLSLSGVDSAGAPSSPALREGLARFVRKFRDEWVEGLRIAATTAQARAVVVFVCLSGIGEGVVATLFAPFLVGVLHGSGFDFGLFIGVQAIGGILGTVLAATVGADRPPAVLLSRFAILFALLDGVLFTYPLVWPVLLPGFVLIAIVGLPAALAMAGFTTLM
ncbi:MAG TPA: MFS transporter, partial [Thermoplasmata archaeon]|nr:MFS transporter [Thermoplasmata archaeon]